MELLELFGGKVLGISWDPPQDVLRMQMKVNLSPRKQGIRTGPDLNLDTLVMINQVELTRRIMLSQVHRVFDSLGLLSPLTIRYKLLIQKIVALGLEWDEILSGDMAESRSVLREMVMAGTVEFPRSAVAGNWSAEGILAGFWNGGNPASACCVYTCSPLLEPGPNGEKYEVHLLAGKARVTPTSKKKGKKRASTPQTEMTGLLMLSRLISEVLPGFQVSPTMIYMGGDSQSTISCVEADDRLLSDIWYTNNRVAEVTENIASWESQGIKVEPLEHWAGEKNVADIATKGRAKLEDILPGSKWQEGPPELRFDRREWPGSRDFVRLLPEDLPLSVEMQSHAISFFGVKTGDPPMMEDELEVRMAKVFSRKLFAGILVQRIREVMKRTNRMKKAVGTIARLLQLSKADVKLMNKQKMSRT